MEEKDNNQTNGYLINAPLEVKVEKSEAVSLFDTFDKKESVSLSNDTKEVRGFSIISLLKIISKSSKNEKVVKYLIEKFDEKKDIEDKLRQSVVLINDNNAQVFQLKSDLNSLEEKREISLGDYKKNLEDEVKRLKLNFKNAREIIIHNENEIKDEIKKMIKIQLPFITIFNKKKIKEVSDRLRSYNEKTEEINISNFDSKIYDDFQKEISLKRNEKIEIENKNFELSIEIKKLEKSKCLVEERIVELSREYEKNEKAEWLNEFKKSISENDEWIKEVKEIIKT